MRKRRLDGILASPRGFPAGTVPALGVLMTAAVAAALGLKRRGVRSFWAYVIVPGSLSWAVQS
jgi:hypothetical protein